MAFACAMARCGYIGAMTEADHTADLARRFIDLWQQQVAAMAGDPALVEMALRFMAPFAAGAGGERAPRAAPAAAAPGDVLARLDELARRLAVCEERLAALEPEPRRGRGGARPRTRPRRP
jgi:hypothetical protein